VGKGVLEVGVGEGVFGFEEADGLVVVVVQVVVMSCSGWEREWWSCRLAALRDALWPHCIDEASRPENR